MDGEGSRTDDESKRIESLSEGICELSAVLITTEYSDLYTKLYQSLHM